MSQKMHRHFPPPPHLNSSVHFASFVWKQRHNFNHLGRRVGVHSERNRNADILGDFFLNGKALIFSRFEF